MKKESTRELVLNLVHHPPLVHWSSCQTLVPQSLTYLSSLAFMSRNACPHSTTDGLVVRNRSPTTSLI